MKLISTLLFGLLIQTANASTSKADCQKACDKCASAVCQEKLSPVVPTPKPTPVPAPVSGIDLKVNSIVLPQLSGSNIIRPSLNPVGVPVQPVGQIPQHIVNQVQYSAVNRGTKDVWVMIEFGVLPVNLATHLADPIGSQEMISTAGYTLVPAGQSIPLAGSSLPLYYGLNRAYRVRVGVKPYEKRSDGSFMALEDSYPSDNSVSVETWSLQ